MTDKELDTLVNQQYMYLENKQSMISKMHFLEEQISSLIGIKKDAMEHNRGRITIKSTNRNLMLNEDESDFILDTLISNYKGSLKALKKEFVDVEK